MSEMSTAVRTESTGTREAVGPVSVAAAKKPVTTLNECVVEIISDSGEGIPAERLKALADARLAHVEESLRSQHGIEPNRIARREAPANAPPSETPAVRVELGPAGAPAAS